MESTLPTWTMEEVMAQEQRAAVDAVLRQPTKPPTTVAEAREQFVEQITRPVPADVRVSDRTLGGRPALVLDPAGQPDDATLLYLHGGGYVVGTPQTHAALAAELAGRAGV